MVDKPCRMGRHDWTMRGAVRFLAADFGSKKMSEKTTEQPFYFIV